MIDKSMNIKEIVTKYPETVEIFKNNGIKGLENKEILEKISTLSLEEILKLKKINVEGFIALLETGIDKEKKRESSKEKVSLMGLLPCPVRIPLLESFKRFLNKNQDIEVDYELKAASAGLGWLKDDVIKADNIDKLADIFISAGFDLFFEKELMGKFKERGAFKDITGITEYNEEFKELKDPYGEYSMIGVVPAIFLVNRDRLGEREIPKSWKDILKPEFKKSISLPIADFDLFNAILINIYKTYGEEGVRALGKNLMSNMHPAEMIGSNGPVVTVMPYFFSKMIDDKSPMKPIWPEDGAILSPIFMLTKKLDETERKGEELRKISEFMSGKEIGEIISHQGLFPSVNPEVENTTKGKPKMWVGWDYIYSNDIGKIIKRCENIFNEGVIEE